MTTENNSAGGTVVPVVPAPVATAPVANPEPKEDPGWLAMRLSQNEKSLLKKLGVDSIDAATSALAEAKKLTESQKTETEKLRSDLAAATLKAARADALEGVVKAKADIAFAGLNEQQKVAVTALAGDDPAKVLATIEALTSFAKPATPPVPAAVIPPVAPVAPNTAPSAVAPTPPTPGAVVSHLATYGALKQSNPMLAASYRLSNLAAIEAEQKTQTSK